MTEVTIHQSPPGNSIPTSVGSIFCLSHLAEEFNVCKTALEDKITSAFFFLFFWMAGGKK